MNLTTVIVVMCLAAFLPLLDAVITVITGTINDTPRHAAKLLVWRGVGYMFLCPISYAVVILFSGFFSNIEVTKWYAVLAAMTWAMCGSVATTTGFILKSRS